MQKGPQLNSFLWLYKWDVIVSRSSWIYESYASAFGILVLCSNHWALMSCGDQVV